MANEEKMLYQRDLTTEVFNWRLKLRNTRYLDNKGDDHSAHTSLCGEALDFELIAFERQCITNMTKYLDGIGQCGLPGKGIDLTPVFTTPFDRNQFHDIQKKTKAQISQIIENAISEVQSQGHVDEAFVLEGQWQKIKAKTKKDMLVFYKEVVVALENATAVESDEDEDSDSEDV